MIAKTVVCVGVCAYVCACVYDFRWSSDCLFLKCPVCPWGYLRRLKRENTKQPRAVLAWKIYPLIFLRQMSMNMASKVKAWLHSNKCSMCMPWVNDVNVIFISSEYNSIHYCLLLLLLVWTYNQSDSTSALSETNQSQLVVRWAAIGLTWTN